MTIIIQGHSDDILDISGDIQGEFYPDTEEPFLIAFPEGTLIEGRYSDEGEWIFRLVTPGSAGYEHYPVNVECADTDQPHDYSETVVLTNLKAEWIVVGKKVKA